MADRGPAEERARQIGFLIAMCALIAGFLILLGIIVPLLIKFWQWALG